MTVEAWLIIHPNGKRMLVCAKKYDALSPDFWVGGAPPSDCRVIPLRNAEPVVKALQGLVSQVQDDPYTTPSLEESIDVLERV